MNDLETLISVYLTKRPAFLSLIRSKEAYLFRKYTPLKSPVLDVGCGDGFFAKIVFAKKLNNETMKQFNNEGNIIDVGLDVEESRIKEAEKEGIYRKLIVYDGLRMPFKGGTFKTVISNCVLEHIPDLSGTMKEISRVLKPGGFFITTVVAKPWEDHLLGTKIVGDFYKRWMRKQQVHLNMLTEGQWNVTFRQSGFKVKDSIGYLSSSACKLIDLAHYFSLPNLVSYKLTGVWVPFPALRFLYPLALFSRIISQNVRSDKSGAIFYVLQKYG